MPLGKKTKIVLVAGAAIGAVLLARKAFAGQLLSTGPGSNVSPPPQPAPQPAPAPLPAPAPAPASGGSSSGGGGQEVFPGGGSGTASGTAAGGEVSGGETGGGGEVSGGTTMSGYVHPLGALIPHLPAVRNGRAAYVPPWLR